MRPLQIQEWEPVALGGRKLRLILLNPYPILCICPFGDNLINQRHHKNGHLKADALKIKGNIILLLIIFLIYKYARDYSIKYYSCIVIPMQFRGPPLKGKNEYFALSFEFSGANRSGSILSGSGNVLGSLPKGPRQTITLDPAGRVH